MQNLQQHLTEQEAARLYGYSRSWFQHKRVYGGGPPYRKIGHAVRYPADELEKWFKSFGLQTNTAQTG